MRKIGIGLIALFALTNGWCQTPGDAAVRGGYFEQGADLYKRGAAQGDSSAALKLGLLIDQGRVSVTTFGNATDWFKKACELGNMPGCHNAANAFEYGKNGVEKDYELARAYYLRAADRGYMPSQYNLGSLYSNGYFTPAEDIEGFKWMLVAEKTALGCRSTPLCKWVLDDPPKHRQRLKDRLSIEDQKKSEALATEWKSIQ
jgi:TPR repeat protein